MENTLLIIAAAVLGVVAIVYAVLHVKRNGYVTPEVAETIDEKTDKAVEIAKGFLQVLDLNPEIERSLNNVLDISSEIVDFVIDVLDESEDKTKLSLDVIGNVLDRLNVKVKLEEQKLIEIVVDESLRYAEKE